ncbi:MAG: hypothetical protein JW800_07065 [Candidatus Omnitrophica bacterium]|nr:hypothetical protein [Candidatus Omnitrophota bacterium]
MKKFIFLALLAILVMGGFYFYAKTSASKPLAPFVEKVDNFFISTKKMLVFFYNSNPCLPDKSSEKKEVALHFKDGSVMIGELVEATDDRYVIYWNGDETVVLASQVERVSSPGEALVDKNNPSDEEISKWWPYNNGVVPRLTNRAVLDAEILGSKEGKVYLLYELEGGGTIEQEIERSKIENLLFKPVDNREGEDTEKILKDLFPKMSFYKTGNITIVTDSNEMLAKEYKQVLLNAYTNIYLAFLGIFKKRVPRVQNFVVIFDDYADFFEYAIADGVPAWAVSGYFSPEDKVLYLFNNMGEKFSEILFQAVVGESGRTMDDAVDYVKGYVDDRYHIFIEGEAKTIKDRFWRAYAYYKNVFNEETFSTLRHEFAHALFANYGLQNIVVSRTDEDKRDELIRRKKEFLEEKDCGKKAKLVKALMRLRSNETTLDMKAANSWLAEGIATYCETNQLGGRNDKWLFLYQDMVRKNAVNPLEMLTVYKMGSFPGVSSEATLHLYAQSWAYTTFLMDRYPEGFMKYQEMMAGKAATGADDLNWLLDSLGKDLREVDREFISYMDDFPEIEDPFVKHFERMYNIFNQ